ncbi:MAG TPA: alpha-amylase family protein [Bryobacteraceae bacterium]|nr:cellulase family glycosylhydrolase [Acidobacteriaceae bacterium]
MIDDRNEITRRDFLLSTAMITASSATSHAQPILSALVGHEVEAAPGTPATEVDMGSVFPAGGVCFRKSNPPMEDWERDHQTASRLGMNTFRHWFMWSALEVAPGKWDWADYDRMMDLAAQNNIKVIIATLDTAAPEWAFRKFSNARYKASDDSITHSSVSASSGVGGFPGLCLDNPEVKALAENFHTRLIEHYRNHPALLGYDLWNETTYNGGRPGKTNCFCDASKKKLQEWLKTKYGSLDQVCKTWHRPSFAEWEDIEPPRDFSGYPESLDWLQHRIDNAYDLFDWRIQLYRRLDPKHLVTCHGVAGTLESYPSAVHNEWMAAKRVDVYGLTWVQSRHGTEPWRQWQSFDLTRAGARGKPFWHAEAQGGPLWMQPQLIGKPREDGRVTEPEDVRIWNMISFAGGARGLLYCRYRPLLDGPLFGAFGSIGMDGSVTPRAEMAGKTLSWANAHPEIWKSRPVRGDVGLLFVPEAELFNYVQQLSTDFYAESMRGAYQAFFDQNIQPDFVALEHIDEYKLIYLAYPVMMHPETVAKLKEYVANGGTLICEGLPAYFGEHGHVGQVQPNYGLDELFGARETYVEFLADIHDHLKMEVNGNNVDGRYFFQEYETKGSGKAAGRYPNGAIAAIENQTGKGRTLLMGSFPGGGYYLHHGKDARTLFAGFLKTASITPRVIVDDNEVQARVHQGAGGSYLWITNPTRISRAVSVALAPELGTFSAGEDRWGNLSIKLTGQQVTVNVPARDAAVIALR